MLAQSSNWPTDLELLYAWTTKTNIGSGRSRVLQIFKCHPITSYCSLALVLLQWVFILAVEEKSKASKAGIPDFDLFHMKSSCVATIKCGVR